MAPEKKSLMSAYERFQKYLKGLEDDDEDLEAVRKQKMADAFGKWEVVVEMYEEPPKNAFARATQAFANYTDKL